MNDIGNVRSAREIKHGLLRRAFRENRGPYMIAKILECSRRVRTMPEGHAEGLALANEWNDMARGVRMLNTIAKQDGLPVTYTDEAADMTPPPSKPVLQ